MTVSSQSPTAGLLVGLVVTLVAIVADGWYMTRQFTRLRLLQTDLADRNRKDSLQLLRIQNDLASLGLAMRDMTDRDEQYPLTAWSSQFARIREDLDAALAAEASVAVAARTADQSQYLNSAVRQFWDAADRIFALAAEDGRQDDARAQIRLSLQARLEALNTAVSRLLVQNYEAEEETSARVAAIYTDVQRQVYYFVAATLTMIGLTSLYVIRSNRRLFARLGALSNARRELAQQLMSARESTLHEISRELHDELGQVLTAMGSMLGRAERRLPSDSAALADVREVQEIAQTTLDRIRTLSQSLHPSALEDAGLEQTVEWYVSNLERQTGLAVSYERTGAALPVDSAVAIHIYRVVQEALSNVSRHSGAKEAAVGLHYDDRWLQLTIEDHGRGFDPAAAPRGLGIVGMRERAAIVGGELTLTRPGHGGTLVTLRVPLRTDHQTAGPTHVG